MAYQRIKGDKARRYRDEATGETISRRQYDQQFGRLKKSGFRTNEEQRAVRAKLGVPSGPARGRLRDKNLPYVTIERTRSGYDIAIAGPMTKTEMYNYTSYLRAAGIRKINVRVVNNVTAWGEKAHPYEVKILNTSKSQIDKLVKRLINQYALNPDKSLGKNRHKMFIVKHLIERD